MAVNSTINSTDLCRSMVFSEDTRAMSSKNLLVLVAAGRRHTACVTSKGVLFTWGNARHGELGDGFQERRLIPQQINSALHGGQPAVIVSCGASHTVVLTEAGCVWTSGDGQFRKLGHGNDEPQLTLKLVSILEGSGPVRMSMVADVKDVY